MALRHRVPEFNAALDRPIDIEKVLPRMPAPSKVEFRSGAPLDSVVALINSNKRVHVDAAVGAGKSAVLPFRIADEMNILVVQVFPNEFFASDLCNYGKSQGKDVSFINETGQDLPMTGVVCISASCLVAKWLETGEACLPKCVVYHDESHEPDAYTYVVKNIAPTLRTVKSYVTATATADGAGFRPMEAGGVVKDVLVPHEKFEAEWDIYGDAPWSVETLEGHMLIFEDAKKKAENLAQQYRLAGMIVHRFHARMTMAEFEMAMRELRDPSSPLVVIIADHTFRSSITFPVTRIIDTAKVVNVVVHDGKPVWNVRSVYESEAYQGRGRGGRLPGQVTTYYRPDTMLKPHVCELEAADVDAAALLFRLLGYLVPRILSSATTSVGDVPRNLRSALNGGAPLACLLPQVKLPIEQFFTPSGRRSPYLKSGYEFERRPLDLKQTSADVANARGAGGVRKIEHPIPEVISAWETQALEREDHMRGGSFGESSYRPSSAVPGPLFHARQETDGRSDEYDHRDSMRRVADAVKAMTAFEDPVDVLDIGTYYYATGLYTSQSSSGSFPEGFESVCKALSRDRSESMHLGLSDYDRSVAVNALLLRYNVKTCEMRVLSRAVPEAKIRGASKDHGALRVWAVGVTETLLSITAELQVLSKYLVRLVRGYCGLAVMEPMFDSEQAGHASVMAEIDALPMAQVGVPGQFMEELRRDWYSQPMAQGYSSAYSSSDGSVDELGRVPMPVTGRGMRALPPASSGLSVSGRSKGGTKEGEYVIRKRGNAYALVNHRRPSDRG